MERREQKQTNNNTGHRTSITSLPRSHPPTIATTHLASHPPTTILQVLDHPHSKLGVGGQAPTPPHHPHGGWPKTAYSSQKGCGTGAQAHENPTPTTPANTTPPRHHPPRSHPLRTPNCNWRRPQHPSIWPGARPERGDRPDGPPFGRSGEPCLPKNRPKTPARQWPTLRSDIAQRPGATRSTFLLQG
jgi:hypothetical protein